MQPHLNAVEQLPQNQVIREDDHRLQSTAYIQIKSRNFEFTDYNHGTRELKEKYGITKETYRYFNKRKFLFSRFQQGIAIDKQSWYSVIPEAVSLYLLNRFKRSKKIKKIFEPFCGVGGIAVHLCDHLEEYIVNDIDRDKIDMLKHNLKIYGKNSNRITFLNQDFLNVEPFQTDALIICPPWGGVDTEQYATHNLDEIMAPKLTEILVHASKFSSNIMLQMPKQTNLQNLMRTINGAGLKAICTVQKVLTNGRLSQLFIYLGSDGFTEINTSQLYNQIYRDLYKEKDSKFEKKRVKSLLQLQSKLVLGEVFVARYPNKIKYFS